MSPLVTAVRLEPRLAYDGTQLRAHFLRAQFGLRGDAAAVFRGPCSVVGDHLVDLADRERGLFIRSLDMLHLIVERFDRDLVRAVLVQRLIAGIVAEILRDRGVADRILRRGDDVYVGEGKLTVSIATVSPVSTLVHFGINVDDRETPVRAAGLAPLRCDPEAFAKDLTDRLSGEILGIDDAVTKVRAVGDVFDHPDQLRAPAGPR